MFPIYSKRFAGPKNVNVTATTLLFVVPADRVHVVKFVSILNLGSTSSSIAIGVGPPALVSYTIGWVVPASSPVTAAIMLPMKPGETMASTCFSATANYNITVSGFDFAA